MSDEIKSAARVLDMLELFSARCDGLTLSEVARGLELPKAALWACCELCTSAVIWSVKGTMTPTA
jgi:hypothetical protein